MTAPALQVIKLDKTRRECTACNQSFLRLDKCFRWKQLIVPTVSAYYGIFILEIPWCQE